MSSKTEHAPEGRTSTRTLSPWTGGPPCRWPTSLERTDRSGHGRARQELDGCALLHPTGAEESVTSAWRVCTSAHLHAFREAEGAGASTPLVRDPGELLSRTYSGSSTRVDNWRRLELNTQDSDEDVLFRQEMRYPERGAPKQRTREMAPRGVLETGLEDRVSREEGSWSCDSRTACRS